MHDAGLNIMLFFARSLRNQIWFEPILILSMASVLASSFTTSVCEIVSVTFSFLDNNICFHVRSNLPKLPGACCHFSRTFRTILYSCPVLLHCLSLSLSWVRLCKKGMLLLLDLPFLFQRYLMRWSWSFKPFQINSFSILRCHTINTITRYRGASHDCKWLRLTIVPNFVHSGYLSIS